MQLVTKIYDFKNDSRVAGTCWVPPPLIDKTSVTMNVSEKQHKECQFDWMYPDF